jgi:ribosomal-protein-alanine N-acetyltransferase
VPGVTEHLADGARTYLRAVTHADADEYVAAAIASRDLHHPWIEAPQDHAAFAGYVDRISDNPAKLGMVFCDRDDDRIAGNLNVSNIVRGPFACAAIGYSVFVHAAGRGLMGDALDTVVGYAFGPLRLHRLEANIQPGNARSIALVKRHGFRLEGFSPDFLFINGAWRDHERWAITAEMV